MFLLLFLLLVYGLLWLVSLALLITGRTLKSQVLSWLGGLPLGALTLGGFAAVALIFWPTNPTDVYEESFGIPPSSDVTQLQGRDYSWGDSGRAYLKFSAAPSTIQRITVKGWRHLSASEAQQETFSSFQQDDTPTWWKPVVGRSSVIYKASKRSGHFSSEYEILVYDESTRQTYYSYSGVD